MLYENYISVNKSQFITKLKNICNSLSIDPDWLMIVMYAESRVNPQAKNPYTNATGLIQFMPSTATDLGTSVNALYNMNNLQQLDYVYLYFKPYKGKIKDIYDLYLTTFFPVALGKSDSWVLQTSTMSSKLIAQQNPGVDLNKDLKITVGEFKQYVANYLKKKTLLQK